MHGLPAAAAYVRVVQACSLYAATAEKRSDDAVVTVFLVPPVYWRGLRRAICTRLAQR